MSQRDKHPDVSIYHSYANGEDALKLHIVALSTSDFPHGLPLDWVFAADDKDEAERTAVRVQKYLDSMRSQAL